MQAASSVSAPLTVDATAGDAPGRSPWWHVWLLAIWLAVPGNLPLWQRVANLTADSASQNVQLLALGLMVLGLIAGLLHLVHWPRLYRPVASLLVLIAAFNSYFMWQYRVVIDTTMMANVANTDAREVRDLLTWHLPAVVAGVAGPALWWIWRRVPAWRAPWRQAGRNLLGVVLSVALTAAALMAGYQGIASLMRGHKELRYMINPLNSVYASGALAVHASSGAVRELEPVGQDAALGASYAAQARPPLLVFVVGETARAQNWGLNGYERQTTPVMAQWAANEGLVNFPDVTSCGTNTQVSVPCMFSPLGRDDGGNAAPRSENLLDVLQRAGLAVFWLDNQSGCKGVCDRVPHAQAAEQPVATLCGEGECLDEVMLNGLDARIAALDPQQRARGVVLVMHQMGSHGPAYHKRAPADRKPFQPECRSVTLSECPADQLRNAYDNSIAYTDHFLGQTLAWLKAHAAAGRWDTGLLYVSDHGESLGENGLFLHGVPYAFAPAQQTRVPMVTWLSPALQQRRGVDAACLRERATRPASHDNLFHSVLGLMDVSTALRNPALDLFAPCGGAAVNASPAG